MATNRQQASSAEADTGEGSGRMKKKQEQGEEGEVSDRGITCTKTEDQRREGSTQEPDRGYGRQEGGMPDGMARARSYLCRGVGVGLMEKMSDFLFQKLFVSMETMGDMREVGWHPFHQSSTRI